MLAKQMEFWKCQFTRFIENSFVNRKFAEVVDQTADLAIGSSWDHLAVDIAKTVRPGNPTRSTVAPTQFQLR
jgi:hypothetical protein